MFRKQRMLRIARNYVVTPESDWHAYYEKMGEVLRRARLQ
mgnify:CR=1 FL=1